MGAGIPREIPGVLDALARASSRRASSSTSRARRTRRRRASSFDPREHWPSRSAPLRRPRFLAIVSAHSLATMLARKATGRVDGFVVEGRPRAGTTRRRAASCSSTPDGEPSTASATSSTSAKIRELGLPFWLAGGAGTPEAAGGARRGRGRRAGRHAVRVLRRVRAHADAQAPRAGARRDGDVAYAHRPARVTDGLSVQGRAAGRHARDRTTRASASATSAFCARRIARRRAARLSLPRRAGRRYVAKGGDIADTVGRRCLCNGLTANIGQPQRARGRRGAAADHQRRRPVVDHASRERAPATRRPT